MLLRDIKTRFHTALRNKFPQGEIDSFFNWLTEAYLNMTRLQVALAPEKELSPSELDKFQEALARLQQQEPIQYILGETEFFGLSFKVNRSVLIPRPETEELVEWILEDRKQENQQPLRILDIGTGSGCIAISLARHLPMAEVTAMDVSEEALAVAKENAERNGLKLNFLQMDILQTESLGQSFDLIVSNPPYVRELEKEQMSPNVLENEPGLALWVKDEDPLLFYRKITQLAQKSLSPQGFLYFEINEAFGRETEQLLIQNSFRTSLKKDIFGKDRMLKGQLEV